MQSRCFPTRLTKPPTNQQSSISEVEIFQTVIYVNNFSAHFMQITGKMRKMAASTARFEYGHGS